MTATLQGDGVITDGHKWSVAGRTTRLLRRRATAPSPTGKVAHDGMIPALPGDGSTADAHGGATVAGRHDS